MAGLGRAIHGKPANPPLSRVDGRANPGHDGDFIRGNHCPSLVTNPLSISLASSSAVRLAGSPQPPPPPDSRTKRSPGRITMPVSLVLIGRGSALPECSV